MILTTTDNVPGREISEILGIVMGSAFDLQFISNNSSFWSATFTGNKSSVNPAQNVTKQCLDELQKNAAGADAILGIKFLQILLLNDEKYIIIQATGTAVSLIPSRK